MKLSLNGANDEGKVGSGLGIHMTRFNNHLISSKSFVCLVFLIYSLPRS